MSHGAMSGSLWQLDTALIEKHAPEAWNAFQDCLKELNIDETGLFEFGKTIMYGESEYFMEWLTDGAWDVDDANEENTQQAYHSVWNHYTSVVTAFKAATGCTIDLFTVDNEDNGSPYDDLRGEVVWTIDAVMMRPEVAALGDGVDFKTWTVYG